VNLRSTGIPTHKDELLWYGCVSHRIAAGIGSGNAHACPARNVGTDAPQVSGEIVKMANMDAMNQRDAGGQ
jgi:hypothetical protein